MSNIRSDHPDVKRWSSLLQDRSDFDVDYRDLAANFLPRAGRFLVDSGHKGSRRHKGIIDNSVIYAVRTLGAGMQAGMNSPARPWFKLATGDDDMNKYGPVKLWLDTVTRKMQRVFAKSNIYRALHAGYEELGVFGTMSGVFERDFATVVHLQPLTVGEYCLATNWKGETDTLYRQFKAPVHQLVRQFGLEKCSLDVQAMYRQGNLDRLIEVVHLIEPRLEYDHTKADSKNMPFRSCYFELRARKGEYLRESGYKTFRGLGARWSTSSVSDAYGNGPGLDALGDAKQLQGQQRSKARAIALMADPPMQASVQDKMAMIDLLPGGLSFTNVAGGLKPAFESRIELAPLLDDIRDVRGRVNQAFHADLFLMLANSVNPQMTATEVAERHEEKMIMLGPVLERMTNEVHTPAIDQVFDAMLEAGIVPPPPQELQGADLNVEFISILAQAQRAISTNGVDRWIANLGQVATFKPDVLDKLNADVWADEYADTLGVSPTIVVPSERVAIIRQQRAQMQAQQAAQEQALQASNVAKNLGAAVSQPGMGDVMQQLSGYTTAGA